MTNLKLTIEMIPKTSHFRNVRSHTTQAQWDRLRRECYRKAKYTCEICNGKGPEHPVECHEVWDFNLTTGIQKLIRLIALCPNCHMVKHFGLAQLRGNTMEAIAHLRRVNQISMFEAAQHVEEAGILYRKRCEVKWKLDMTAIGI